MYTAEERAQAELDYNALNAANIKDAQGYTPIHHASIKGHQEMINLLGEFDEDMILLSIRDASGSTALHHAVENGHIDIQHFQHFQIFYN